MAAWITLAIILCIPKYFDKYVVNEIDKESPNDFNSIIYFSDLDNDNKSEKIIAQTNTLGNASFLLYKSNDNFIDQFNTSKQFTDNYKTLWFQDADADGLKEIYFLTQAQDSLFLNIFEPFSKLKNNVKQIFLDTVPSFNNEYKVNSYRPTLFSQQRDNNKEVIIEISAGFSGYPRNVYKYDTLSNHIVKSPHITNPFGVQHIIDIDLDGKNEYFISNSAAGNKIDSMYTKRTDYSTWLTVLDDDLSFFFKPHEFKALGSVQSISLVEGNSNKLIGLFYSRQPELVPSKLFNFNLSGFIEEEIILPPGEYNNLIYPIKDNTILINNKAKGIVYRYDARLKLLNEYPIEKKVVLDYFDVNGDGMKEWIAFHSDNQKVTIYDPNFDEGISFKFSDINGSQPKYCGLRQLSTTESQMYFQKGNVLKLFSYERNPIYSFQYLIYLGIYGVILGLVWLIIKGQKIREAKRRAIENEISELQIKTVKNQVDPHFVFNAINTISEMTLTDNKIEADNFICRFSDFMRQTLQSSDKISTTLKEELEYTENFIKLQQIRYDQSFDYTIRLDQAVNVNTMVPKHVLFTYVENAIKHGLANSLNKGFIKIRAINKNDGLLLSVEDNGVGINPSKEPKKNSTGNGLLIMEKIYELYTKLTKKKIKHKIVELYNDSNQKSGIRVEVFISKT